MKGEMRWLNLRDGSCPKCGEMMDQDKHPTHPYLNCRHCHFRISERRCAEIIKGMSETKKWRGSFNDEIEDNQSRLNNL